MSNNEGDPKQQKEGLQAAIDFTKFLLTLAGGAIAFVIQPSFFGSDQTLKIMALFALFCFAICVVSGLAVFSAGAVRLAKGEYDLESCYVKIPGQINVISFGLGFLILAIVIGIKLYAA